MSTTRSTTETGPEPSYTVVGGRRDGRLARYTSRLTIAAISREGKLYREEFLARYHNHPLAEVLYIEGPEGSVAVGVTRKRGDGADALQHDGDGSELSA